MATLLFDLFVLFTKRKAGWKREPIALRGKVVKKGQGDRGERR